MRRAARSLAALLAALSLGACAATGAGDGTAAGEPSPGDRLSGGITVFAAASLQATFTQIGKELEAAHPGTSVTFSFAGSSDLLSQLQQGAPADVFASADTRHMDLARADALVVGTPAVFATNTLQIAVPPDNPATVSALQDLARADVKTVLCAPQVPCGSAAVRVEKAAGIDIRPVSEEQSVADVLGKVAAGEADAGLVYLTDVRAAQGRVQGVPFTESAAAVNTYTIARVGDGDDAGLAQAFIDAVIGRRGQDVLRAAGFGSP